MSNTRSLTSGRRAAIEGSAGDPDPTKRVAAEVDVVLSAFSPSRAGGNLREYLDLLTVVAETVGDARLVVVGGAGSLLVNGQRVVDDPEYPGVWRPEALLMSEALAYIQGLGDDIDWTFCSPAVVIEPDGRTGQYKIGDDSPVGDRLSTEDYAVALLDEIETPAHPRRRFTVAN